MLNNIIFLLNDKENIPPSFNDSIYNILTDTEGASAQESLVVTDDVSRCAELASAGYALILVYDGDEYVDGVAYIVQDFKGCTIKYCEEAFARQKGLALTVIRTERTYIKEITVEDLPELYRLYDDDEIRRYVDALYEYDEEAEFTRNYIRCMYGFYGVGMWLVRSLEDDHLIGRAGIEIRQIDGEDQFELGYIIGKEDRRKGYALEVCKAIEQYAFDVLPDTNKLNIIISPDNKASINLAKKLGARAACSFTDNGLEYVLYECVRPD